MITSKEGRDLIKQKESLQLIGYLCPADIPTIGWGHTGLVKGKVIVPKVTKITLSEAEALLTQNLVRFETAVTKNVKVRLTQGQFDALVSFTYNLGVGGLQAMIKSSGLNEGNYAGVPGRMKLYCTAKVKVQVKDPKTGKVETKIVSKELEGLKTRRSQEIALWNKK